MEWQLRPLDTLFFRGPLPFTAGETVFLPSEFPPSPQTIQGMVRTALLEAHGIDFDRFALDDFTAPACSLCTDAAVCQVPGIVGQPGSDLGTLDLRGPYLIHHDTRLYPAPDDLRWQHGIITRSAPGPAIQCDAGRVRLPEAQGGTMSEWITESGLITYLAGATPPSDQFKATHSLLTPEPRVGLALDVATRAAREGMLYSIAPVRLRDGVSLGVRVTGAREPLLMQVPATCRLGGEGRIVEVTPHQESSLPVPPTVEASLRATGRFRLLLLQPADFAGSWLPAGFTATEIDETTCWRGTLDGVALRIVVSCGGPPIAIGGWDMVKREAKALRWCVPAGTVYYCELETGSDVQRVLQQFHDRKLGANAPMGFGHVVIGAWPALEGGDAL